MEGYPFESPQRHMQTRKTMSKCSLFPFHPAKKGSPDSFWYILLMTRNPSQNNVMFYETTTVVEAIKNQIKICILRVGFYKAIATYLSIFDFNIQQ